MLISYMTSLVCHADHKGPAINHSSFTTLGTLSEHGRMNLWKAHLLLCLQKVLTRELACLMHCVIHCNIFVSMASALVHTVLWAIDRHTYVLFSTISTSMDTATSLPQPGYQAVIRLYHSDQVSFCSPFLSSVWENAFKSSVFFIKQLYSFSSKTLAFPVNLSSSLCGQSSSALHLPQDPG